MAVNYTDVQKTEKYISRTNFNALEMAAIPEGMEFNIVDQIHESDLDSDVLQKLNNNAKINTANTFTAAQTFKKDITIEGNIFQNGSAYETHAEKLYTKNDMIYTRDGATAALADNAYTGIQAVKYDGTNDGQLVFGKDGVARVGDVGKTQPLATRAEKGALTDGHLLQWDAAGQTLVDSGKSVSDLEGGGGDVTAAGNNTFTGSNKFEGTVNFSSITAGAISFAGKPSFNAGIELVTGVISFRDKTATLPSATGTLALADDDLGNVIQFKENTLIGSKCSLIRDVTTWIKNGYGSYCSPGYLVAGFGSGDSSSAAGTTAIGPNGLYKLGTRANTLKFALPDVLTTDNTLALVSDLPVANPSDAGTTTLTKLKIGDVVYSIPSGGGSGDVTAAGNNMFTGTNAFTGKSTFTGNIDFIGPNIFYEKLQVSNLTGNIGSKDYGIFISAMDGIKCVAPEGDSTTSYKQFTLNSEYVEFHAGDIVYTQKLKTATPLSQNSVLKLPDKAIGTLAITDDIPITSATLSDNGTTLTLVLR